MAEFYSARGKPNLAAFVDYFCTAVLTLITAIREEGVVKSMELPTDLIARNSTAVLRKGLSQITP